MPEERKTNRRRAAIFAVVFLSVLGSIIYFLRVEHCYLKWRFVGGGEGMIGPALEYGDISTDQVITLINSGATWEVRREALCTVRTSSRFRPPLSDSAVRAITEFARDLPADPRMKEEALWAIAHAASRASRVELLPVLKRLAADPSPRVRVGVAFAFGDGGPAWAVPVLAVLLSDADAEVRHRAVWAVMGFHGKGVDTSSLLPRVRAILRSRTEVEKLRVVALRTLSRCGQLGEEQITSYMNDYQVRVAAEARRLLDSLRSEVNDDGERAAPDPGPEQAPSSD